MTASLLSLFPGARLRTRLVGFTVSVLGFATLPTGGGAALCDIGEGFCDTDGGYIWGTEGGCFS